ncbi:MAG: biopolymer transporter ExbD [Muribaculaceae bacterium]|nr:biopolymer transporter ExbD [Muribaculaceae bacterium]
MAQIEQSDKGGKKKKGAQKKMAIHVDFTPMVDMNMLLITFFMLCTTMIKSQTLSIVLPSNQKSESKSEAKASEAITMILDTEYDENGTPKFDAEANKTIHNIYWYKGVPDTVNFATNSKDATKNYLNVQSFVGNENGSRQGIRAILYDQNKEVMERYTKLKEQWKNKEITDEQFKDAAKKNAADSTLARPVVVIKPGPNTTYEGLINAIDEMNLNQISRYSIQMPNHADTVLLQHYEAANPGTTIIRPLVREKKN